MHFSSMYVYVSHTKPNESLKPEQQRPHECLFCTPSLQTLLPASLHLFFLFFWTQHSHASHTITSDNRQVALLICQWISVERCCANTYSKFMSFSLQQNLSSSFKNTTSSFRLSFSINRLINTRSWPQTVCQQMTAAHGNGLSPYHINLKSVSSVRFFFNVYIN